MVSRSAWPPTSSRVPKKASRGTRTRAIAALAACTPKKSRAAGWLRNTSMSRKVAALIFSRSRFAHAPSDRYRVKFERQSVSGYSRWPALHPYSCRSRTSVSRRRGAPHTGCARGSAAGGSPPWLFLTLHLLHARAASVGNLDEAEGEVGQDMSCARRRVPRKNRAGSGTSPCRRCVRALMETWRFRARQGQFSFSDSTGCPHFRRSG